MQLHKNEIPSIEHNVLFLCEGWSRQLFTTLKFVKKSWIVFFFIIYKITK